jgi:hypothetical protein
LKASAESLHRRVREIRSRAAVRRWETRQLDHAAGAWFRMQRLLAYARTAWAISDSDAEGLISAGHPLEPAGLELEPPRRIFVVDEAQLAGLTSATEASPELLAFRSLALVPFEDCHPGSKSRGGLRPTRTRP